MLQHPRGCASPRHVSRFRVGSRQSNQSSVSRGRPNPTRSVDIGRVGEKGRLWPLLLVAVFHGLWGPPIEKGRSLFSLSLWMGLFFFFFFANLPLPQEEHEVMGQEKCLARGLSCCGWGCVGRVWGEQKQKKERKKRKERRTHQKMGSFARHKGQKTRDRWRLSCPWKRTEEKQTLEKKKKANADGAQTKDER